MAAAKHKGDEKVDKHIVLISNRQRKIKVEDALKQLVAHCVHAVLQVENFEQEAEVGVTLVSNKKIREYNQEFRGIDKATDVLSFPLLEYEEDEESACSIGDINHEYEEDTVLLGDIVLSLEQAQIQAKEYGHSFLREVGYLTVHSMYHLLGYDHMTDEEKTQMREKEERVLKVLNLPR